MKPFEFYIYGALNSIWIHIFMTVNTLGRVRIMKKKKMLAFLLKLRTWSQSYAVKLYTIVAECMLVTLAKTSVLHITWPLTRDRGVMG